MSYILDALRRADAERERGSIPGLHSQSAPLGVNELDAPRGPQPWVWVLLGMGLVVCGVLLWLWLFGESAPEARAVRPPLPVTLAEPSPLTPPLVAVPAPAAAPAPPLSTPPSGPSTAAVAPSAAAVLPSETASARVRAPRPAASDVSPRAGRKPDAAAEPPPELRAPPLAALPEALRRELPQLAVGGSVYAKTPANRILILNGQPFHEGDSPMAELVLEQIKLKSAVLKYKGQRFELTY